MVVKVMIKRKNKSIVFQVVEGNPELTMDPASGI